jgi:hypothetical protein
MLTQLTQPQNMTQMEIHHHSSNARKNPKNPHRNLQSSSRRNLSHPGNLRQPQKTSYIQISQSSTKNPSSPRHTAHPTLHKLNTALDSVIAHYTTIKQTPYQHRLRPTFRTHIDDLTTSIQLLQHAAQSYNTSISGEITDTIETAAINIKSRERKQILSKKRKHKPHTPTRSFHRHRKKRPRTSVPPTNTKNPHTYQISKDSLETLTTTLNQCGLHHRRLVESITTLCTYLTTTYSHHTLQQTTEHRFHLHQTKLKSIQQNVKTTYYKLLNIKDSPQINFHASIGLSRIAAQKGIPNPQLQSNANVTFPTRTAPHQPPLDIPAVGPAQKVAATKATQQAQCAPAPGKALHFADIKNDDVGPSGLSLHLNRTFTNANLDSYHPDSSSLPPDTKQHIVDAHQYFQNHVKKIQKRYKNKGNRPKSQWPFFFKPKNTSYRSSTIFSTPLPDLIETISHIPSKSRYKGFTLNVLARLHPAWTESFQSLIPLILTTRILPKGLKLTGRTLIDKPKSTDKRPISVVQALDAHLDSIVNSRLAATVESLNVLDHTIAAYRKGKSCTDLTLNNILAIEDTCHYHNHILAHIDEDKENTLIASPTNSNSFHSTSLTSHLKAILNG